MFAGNISLFHQAIYSTWNLHTCRYDSCKKIPVSNDLVDAIEVDFESAEGSKSDISIELIVVI